VEIKINQVEIHLIDTLNLYYENSLEIFVDAIFTINVAISTFIYKCHTKAAERSELKIHHVHNRWKYTPSKSEHTQNVSFTDPCF
jgi:hypothetical protein